MRRFELYLWALVFALLLGAQSIGPPLPNPQVSLNPYMGAALPTKCSTGSLFFLTTAAAGANIYGCVSNAYVLEGVSGSGGITLYSDSETPGGSVDGSNQVFTLAFAPSPAGSLLLMRNGLTLYSGGDYTLSGSTITFAPSAVPQSGDSLLAWYRHL
jgi:hypothetical protein